MPWPTWRITQKAEIAKAQTPGLRERFTAFWVQNRNENTLFHRETERTMEMQIQKRKRKKNTSQNPVNTREKSHWLRSRVAQNQRGSNRQRYLGLRCFEALRKCAIRRYQRKTTHIYKLAINIPKFTLTHPPLFHQTFHQSIPSYHKFKILILTFQIFNQSQKGEHPPT